MFHAPEYFKNASVQLSEVLNDVGVTERMVRKRRRACLLQESMYTLNQRSVGDQDSIYLLGSTCEGTTTSGLHSDFDRLTCNSRYSVIQDWAEWCPGNINLLMIQDDTTTPGYCYLQYIRNDVPLPVIEEYENHCVKDTQGRVLMKNTVIDGLRPECQREGPSLALQGTLGFSDEDCIIAYAFKSLPQSVQHWLDHDHSWWPNAEMKKYAATSDCFVVPTGSSVSENKDSQWRISTSLAERCFIFNLNITQIRCYILLKMILKTFINLHGQKHITSYMCKTVLLHCIRSKPSHVWRDSNILNCLTYCLSTLYQCILCGNCPHFIIPANNLMAGKISGENKHQLLEQMSNIMRYTAGSLLRIQIDDLGQRLLLKFGIIHGVDYNAIFSAEKTELSLPSAELSFNTARCIESCYTAILLFFKTRSPETQIHFLRQTVNNLARYHNERNLFVQTACRLLSPLFSSTLGSMMASHNIQQNNHVSPQALGWLSAGINSDVSSGRLKFASVFYCTGDMESAAFLLRDTKARYYIQIVQPLCMCYRYPASVLRGFSIISLHYNEEMLKYKTAFCVKFLPSEINCTPKELQYEMFRSSGEELLHREEKDTWMDWAVVDSIPYLYFLRYKTYGYLQRIQDQQRALNNLCFVTASCQYLGHRETAWNLLGQCMEQENRLGDALQCYRNSLHVRQTNNVARIHICKLLARQIVLARENYL